MPARRRKGERTANEDLPPGRGIRDPQRRSTRHRPGAPPRARRPCRRHRRPPGRTAQSRGTCQEGDTAFLPDVVLYRPGMSAAFEPGGGNGRALDDDSVDIAVGFLAGSPLGGAVVPRPPSPAFPYLSAPQPADLPALADLFGRCSQHSERTPSPAGRRPWRVLLTFASRRRTRHVRATTRLSTLAFKPVKGTHHGRATPKSPLR
jgi:hypothetical protein